MNPDSALFSADGSQPARAVPPQPQTKTRIRPRNSRRDTEKVLTQEQIFMAVTIRFTARFTGPTEIRDTYWACLDINGVRES